jgi:HSP20 family protein
MIENALETNSIMTHIKINPNTSRGFAPVFSTLLNEMLETGFPDIRHNHGGTALPAVNISESSAGIQLELCIPGFSKEEINITLDEKNLIISGEKKPIDVDPEKRFTRKEFGFQSFKRRFALAEKVDQSAITAKFENGILHIEMPKKAETEKITRKIELQ